MNDSLFATSNKAARENLPIEESRKIDNIFVASREQSYGSRLTRRFAILSIFPASTFRDICELVDRAVKAYP